MFRAAARATGPVLNARDLASVTITYAEDQDGAQLACAVLTSFPFGLRKKKMWRCRQILR